jgi:hypothetical protein
VTKLSDDLSIALSMGPSRKVKTWKRYSINGFNFRAFDEKKDMEKRTQNNGVSVSSSEGNDYYGTLHEVIELSYNGERRSYTTILFRCDWVDVSNRGTRVHKVYKLVEVNRSKKYPIYDPFVLAYQADLVYYTPFPNTKKDTNQWSAVFKTKARSHINAPIDETVYQEDNIPHGSRLEVTEIVDEEEEEGDVSINNAPLEVVEEADEEEENADDIGLIEDGEEDEGEGDDIDEELFSEEEDHTDTHDASSIDDE